MEACKRMPSHRYGVHRRLCTVLNFTVNWRWIGSSLRRPRKEKSCRHTQMWWSKEQRTWPLLGKGKSSVRLELSMWGGGFTQVKAEEEIKSHVTKCADITVKKFGRGQILNWNNTILATLLKKWNSNLWVCQVSKQTTQFSDNSQFSCSDCR